MNELHVLPVKDVVANEQRRYPRLVSTERTRIKAGRWPLRNSHKAVVRDLSETGALVELDYGTTLQVGERVRLHVSVQADRAQSTSVASFPIFGTVIRKESRHLYGLRFTQTVAEQVQNKLSVPRKIFAGSGIFLLGIAIALLKMRNVSVFWYEPALETYSIFAAVFVLSRVGISMFYREPADQGYLPTITLIIAAMNEEAHIADTIRHCYRSRYPHEKMEVIAIDDGSKDKTWEAMSALTKEYSTLKIFRFEKNKGKRHGMAYGAEQATGDVLVYVDSDSYVDPESVYRIVQPFANSKIGAVSGHVLAVEEKDNFISKMEAARYYISHRIMKAAESVFGAVTCCPGAFSAYRRSAVMRILPDWLNQTFMGTQATFGDDRSLTNFILRTHQVIYHSGARCVTFVPNKWSQFFRQQLRWKKSWARETTVAARQMYKMHPIAAFSYYASIILTVLSPIMALRAIVVIPLMTSASCLPYLSGLFLMYTFLCLFYCYHTQSKTWYYGLAFACLYLTVLCYQNYYAMLTVRRNHWGTR